MEIKVVKRRSTIVEGQIFKTNSGSELEVIKYICAKDILVQFTDKKTAPFKAHVGNLRKGKYKNPYQPFLLGVGFHGVGKYSSKIHKEAFKCWTYLLYRIFSEVEHKQRPSTGDLIIYNDWLNFQNFAEWHEQNYITGWELDKDILVKYNNLYSPQTCCFVPREINTRYPKRHSKSDRVYSNKINKYQAQARNIHGVRKAFSSKDRGEVVAWKIKAVKEVLDYLAEKYSANLRKDVYHSLKNWNGYEENK